MQKPQYKIRKGRRPPNHYNSNDLKIGMTANEDDFRPSRPQNSLPRRQQLSHIVQSNDQSKSSWRISFGSKRKPQNLNQLQGRKRKESTVKNAWGPSSTMQEPEKERHTLAQPPAETADRTVATLKLVFLGGYFSIQDSVPLGFRQGVASVHEQIKSYLETPLTERRIEITEISYWKEDRHRFTRLSESVCNLLSNPETVSGRVFLAVELAGPPYGKVFTFVSGSQRKVCQLVPEFSFWEDFDLWKKDHIKPLCNQFTEGEEKAAKLGHRLKDFDGLEGSHTFQLNCQVGADTLSVKGAARKDTSTSMQGSMEVQDAETPPRHQRIAMPQEKRSSLNPKDIEVAEGALTIEQFRVAGCTTHSVSGALSLSDYRSWVGDSCPSASFTSQGFSPQSPSNTETNFLPSDWSADYQLHDDNDTNTSTNSIRSSSYRAPSLAPLSQIYEEAQRWLEEEKQSLANISTVLTETTPHTCRFSKDLDLEQSERDASSLESGFSFRPALRSEMLPPAAEPETLDILVLSKDLELVRELDAPTRQPEDLEELNLPRLDAFGGGVAGAPDQIKPAQGLLYPKLKATERIQNSPTQSKQSMKCPAHQLIGDEDLNDHLTELNGMMQDLQAKLEEMPPSKKSSGLEPYEYREAQINGHTDWHGETWLSNPLWEKGLFSRKKSGIMSAIQECETGSELTHDESPRKKAGQKESFSTNEATPTTLLYNDRLAVDGSNGALSSYINISNGTKSSGLETTDARFIGRRVGFGPVRQFVEDHKQVVEKQGLQRSCSVESNLSDITTFSVDSNGTGLQTNVSDITWDTFIGDYFIMANDTSSKKDVDELSFILEHELRKGLVTSDPQLAEAVEARDDSNSLFADWYQLAQSQYQPVVNPIHQSREEDTEHLEDIFLEKEDPGIEI